MADYVLTSEHQAQLPAWRDKWLKNSLSCEPMSAHDRERTSWAVNGLYKSVNIVPPKRTIFVPSPFLLRFAGGFAAALIYMRDKRHMTLPEVQMPLPDKTGVRADIIRATLAAINGTGETLISGTASPRLVAPCEGIEKGKDWYRIDIPEVREAAKILGGDEYKFLLSCAAASYRMWQGGNQWSAWVGFLSFFRDVVGAKLPHEDVWEYWYAGTVHSGPRIVHPDFVMISDRPEVMTVDDRWRPHNADGPFAVWRDGTALYSWHGMRIPRWYVERKDLMTAATIESEVNAEQRRAMIEIFTSERYIRESGCTKEHQDETGILWRRAFGNGTRRGAPDDVWSCVEVINGTREPDGTFKHYFLQVPPTVTTAKEAVAWTYGMTADEYTRLTIRT
jgi:hypothetical protein